MINLKGEDFIPIRNGNYLLYKTTLNVGRNDVIIVVSPVTKKTVRFQYDRIHTVGDISKDLINHTEDLYDYNTKIMIFDEYEIPNRNISLIFITTEKISV